MLQSCFNAEFEATVQQLNVFSAENNDGGWSIGAGRRADHTVDAI